jgi:aminomethyltransferase
MAERAIARPGCRVMQGDEPVGSVTSGTQTPYVKKAIGMAYVPIALSTPGTPLEVDIRGRRALATVVPLPFYRRPPPR